MTRLPWDSWNVTAEPDEPKYELADVCAACATKWGLEDHHIWRRSFGKDFRDAWWVRLENGDLVPNRVHLCGDCHRLVTENEARIDLVPLEGGTYQFWWIQDGSSAFPLAPQPGPHGAVEHTAVGNPGNPGAMQLTVDGGEKPHDEVCEEQHGVEEECPRCHGAGKVRRRNKRNAGENKPAQKKTWSIRYPAAEQGADEAWESVFQASVDLMVKGGLLRDTKNAGYYGLMVLGAFFLQNFNPREDA